MPAGRWNAAQKQRPWRAFFWVDLEADYSTNRAPAMSSGVAFIRELDAPEVSCGMVHFDAELEATVIFLAAQVNNAKFAHFIGEAVQDLNARTERGQEWNTE